MRPDLRSELLRRVERLQGIHGKTGCDPEAVSEVDADNLAWLRSVLAEIGWPGRSMVGPEGADAAWLLAQHAYRDHVFQRQCLDLLGRAAEVGEATPAQVACLTDRVLLAEGQQQEYGTELTGRDGLWVAPRLRDPNTVDERRAAVSLGSLADHIASITAQYGPPQPSLVACAECGAAIEVWLPDPGDEQTANCAACGWTVTLTAGAPPSTLRLRVRLSSEREVVEPCDGGHGVVHAIAAQATVAQDLPRNHAGEGVLDVGSAARWIRPASSTVKMGGIWEITSRVNVPEPLSTELKKSI